MDQKHEETATAEGMPEKPASEETPQTPRRGRMPPKAPPVDNNHVAAGAEQFATGQSTSALEVEVQHLQKKVHDMEEALHTYLSTQTSVGHWKISTWVRSVGNRLALLGSTQPAPTETTAPSGSPAGVPTE